MISYATRFHMEIKFFLSSSNRNRLTNLRDFVAQYLDCPMVGMDSDQDYAKVHNIVRKERKDVVEYERQ